MSNTPMILFVIPDSGDRKYIKEVAASYDVKTVYSLKQMEECIYMGRLDLIIIDKELIKNQSDESLARWICSRKMIPLILLIGSNDDALLAIKIRASDFVYKPIIPELLIYQINKTFHHIEEVKMSTKINVMINDQLKEKSKKLEELQANIIGVISEIIEFRDFGMSSHDLRSQAYVKLMIKKMIEIPNPYQKEISLWNIQDYILSAQLHDIGKIVVPNEVLTKPGLLTGEEYELVKEHVMMGVAIINKIIEWVGDNSYLSIARKYVESHHEFWNGKGYPYKLSGTNIPLEGRILAIVDAYDVITSERSYKKAKTHEEAIEIINKDSGTQFDPELIKIFNMASEEFKALKDRNIWNI